MGDSIWGQWERTGVEAVDQRLMVPVGHLMRRVRSRWPAVLAKVEGCRIMVAVEVGANLYLLLSV